MAFDSLESLSIKTIIERLLPNMNDEDAEGLSKVNDIISDFPEGTQFDVLESLQAKLPLSDRARHQFLADLLAKDARLLVFVSRLNRNKERLGKLLWRINSALQTRELKIVMEHTLVGRIKDALFSNVLSCDPAKDALVNILTVSDFLFDYDWCEESLEALNLFPGLYDLADGEKGEAEAKLRFRRLRATVMLKRPFAEDYVWLKDLADNAGETILARNETLAANVYTELSNAALRMSEFDTSLYFCKRALRSIRSAKLEEDPLAVGLLLQCSEVFGANGHLTKGIKLAKGAEGLALKALGKYSFKMVEVYSILWKLYDTVEMASDAMPYFERALMLSNKFFFGLGSETTASMTSSPRFLRRLVWRTYKPNPLSDRELAAITGVAGRRPEVEAQESLVRQVMKYWYYPKNYWPGAALMYLLGDAYRDDDLAEAYRAGAKEEILEMVDVHKEHWSYWNLSVAEAIECALDFASHDPIKYLDIY